MHHVLTMKTILASTIKAPIHLHPSAPQHRLLPPTIPSAKMGKARYHHDSLLACHWAKSSLFGRKPLSICVTKNGLKLVLTPLPSHLLSICLTLPNHLLSTHLYHHHYYQSNLQSTSISHHLVIRSALPFKNQEPNNTNFLPVKPSLDENPPGTWKRKIRQRSTERLVKSQISRIV